MWAGGGATTSMEYYLASVIDYLNWVHGDPHIDFNSVLGISIPKAVPPGFQSVAGSDFEKEGDVKKWSVKNGRLSRSENWSKFGGHSMRVDLQPGGGPVEFKGSFTGVNSPKFSLWGYYEGPHEKIDFGLTLTTEQGVVYTATDVARFGSLIRLNCSLPPAAANEKFSRISISANNTDEAITFYIDCAGFYDPYAHLRPPAPVREPDPVS